MFIIGQFSTRVLSRSLPKIIVIATFAAFAPIEYAQPMSFQRDRGREILATIKSDLQKMYYDPGFHGVNVDAVFQEADELLKKADSAG